MKKPIPFSVRNLKIDALKKELSKKIPSSKKTESEEKKETPKLAILAPLSPVVTMIGVKTEKTYKLKITATDIQCIASTDSDKKDDYEINQSVVYKAKGQFKRPISRDFYSYRIRTGRVDLSEKELLKTMHPFDVDNVIPIPQRATGSGPSGHQDNYQKKGANRLTYGDYGTNIDKGFWVKKGDEEKFITIGVKQGDSRNLKNLYNSMVFEITPEELKDTNAEMMIYTLVSERSSKYSNDTIHYNHDGAEIHVAIKDVLDILTGKRKLNDNKPYFDNSIAKGIKFDNFDGFKLPLTKVDYPTKTILEGPIRARGKSAANKAALWMRFELID